MNTISQRNWFHRRAVGDRNQGLGMLVRGGRLLPIQAQLAASLGFAEARALGLPTLNLRPHGMQWLVGVHRGLPRDVRRVLRSATRSSAYALPPILSVTWGIDCAARALPAFELALPGDARPRQAIEMAGAWLNGRADTAPCSAAATQANEAIQAATAAGVRPFARAKIVGGTRLLYPAEAAVYAAREAVRAVPRFADAHTPKWMISDHAAICAGHAANYATCVQPDSTGEHEWQRQRLIELILSWDADRWATSAG